MENTVTLTISTELVKRIVEESTREDNELYIAITEAYKGRPLSELPFEQWSQHWPVVDGNLVLTGDVVDSDTEDWLNYNDEAAIWRWTAEDADWIIDDEQCTARPK